LGDGELRAKGELAELPTPFTVECGVYGIRAGAEVTPAHHAVHELVVGDVELFEVALAYHRHLGEAASTIELGVFSHRVGLGDGSHPETNENDEGDEADSAAEESEHSLRVANKGNGRDEEEGAGGSDSDEACEDEPLDVEGEVLVLNLPEEGVEGPDRQ